MNLGIDMVIAPPQYRNWGVNDRTLNPLDITYQSEHVGNGVWDVKTLSITDQSTNATFFYDFSFQPAQTFRFDGQNTFLGQSLIVQGRSSNAVTAKSDSISIQYIGNPVCTIPEPGTSVLAFIVLAACFRRGRRWA